MNATLNAYSTSAPAFGRQTNTSKPLWAAVGVLGVCVVAMGGALVHVATSKPSESLTAATVQAPSLMSGLLPITAPSSSTANTEPTQSTIFEKKTANVAAKTSSVAAKSVAKHDDHPAVPVAANSEPVSQRAPVVEAAPAPVAAPVATPIVVAQAPAPVVAKPVCASCGVVESVTPIIRQGEAGAVGTIAGGVVGAVLGNQVGDGNGRAIATVLGGVGGVLAGRAIEKNAKKTTVYNVQVRMEDGSLRSFEQATSMAVGAKVKVEAGSLHAG